MPIGTTNLNLRTSLYSEMGKGTGGTNYSLGQAKYGVNDIDIAEYAAQNPSMVKMSYWQNYDHESLQFRFNPIQTLESDTYDDTSTNAFGVDGAGIAYTNTNGTSVRDQGWDYPGTSGYYGRFAAVSSGTAYKAGTSGIMVMCGWINTRSNSAGQTTILNPDGPIGTVSAFRGYRLDIRHDTLKLRVIRGDGGGTTINDRRTFESTGVLPTNEWVFVAFQGVYNNTSLGTTANYFWTWSQGGGWSNGISFISGGGGNVAYSATDRFSVSPGNNGGRYWDGIFGAWYVFDQVMTTADIESLKDNTAPLYGY